MSKRLRTEEQGLAHALKTHQVDAIVGNRDIMLVRLREAEEELQRSRNQLRALSANLLSVRDDERVAIARELHDEFGQVLTSLQLGLSWLSRRVAPEQQPLQRRIRSLSDLTTTMIRSVASITGELRPGTVDELGLQRTLRSVVKEFEASTGIRCGFRTNAASVTFDRPVAVAVFRIVQAALTNVIRHAHASAAVVSLVKGRADLIVTVKDNGKGISRTLVESQESIGIIGMRERTRALEGTFSLEGSKGKGTVMTVRIPLSRVVLRRVARQRVR